ncbi:hypothetical protein K457DRAFT_136322 [Linnemannia elongata AG-77]|uniref:RING-type domain-containing protein n=1 Tax=Linnemannia elongata AG-77 TaxID=1314771 RepID=A0A197K4N2_9FUNG|nr:hypothetical protein K457DRAFT_136322 [Linnemannia elongata AG-77]
MQSLPIYLPGQSTTDSSATGPSPPTSSSSGRRARSRSPSFPSSSSARHYSPVAVPYPVVYSSPSLIDSARSSIYSIYSQHIPPPIIPLSSSPPPSSSLSNGAPLTVEQQQQLQLHLQLQQLQQLQQQHPPSPPLYSSPYNPLMLSRPLELPSMVSAPASASSRPSSITAAGGGAGGPTDHRFSFASSSSSSSSFFSPSPSSPSFASTSLPSSSDPTQQEQQRRQYHHQQQHQHQQQLHSTVLAMSNPTSTSPSTSTPQSHPLSIDAALDSSTNNNNITNDNNSNDNSSTSDINHTSVNMSMSIDRDRDQETALSQPANGTVSRPRSVMDLAIDSAGGNPAGRRVRRNLMARFSDRWDTLPRNSRIILCLTGAMTFAKVVASTTVLIIDRNAQCVSPNLTYLKVLIGLYALLPAFTFPFTVYSHLHPRVQGAPLTARDINLERQRTFMEVAGTCLFFLSNYFLFSGTTCRESAPAVFYLTVVYVVLGYTVILIPVILCLTVILCLPLVLRVMRYFNLGPVVGIKGATEEMIASIPIVKYRTPATARGSGGAEASRGQNEAAFNMSERTGAGTGTSAGAGAGTASSSHPGGQSAEIGAEPVSSSSATEEARQRQKGGLFGFFRKGKKGSSSGAAGKSQDAASPHTSGSSPVEYLTLEDEQDAVCAICLCEYEDDEELRKMRCTHYFHKECVDEWLRLHRNCPLCKRDIEELAGLRDPSAAGSSSPSGASPSTRGPASAGSSSQHFRRATS